MIKMGKENIIKIILTVHQTYNSEFDKELKRKGQTKILYHEKIKTNSGGILENSVMDYFGEMNEVCRDIALCLEFFRAKEKSSRISLESEEILEKRYLFEGIVNNTDLKEVENLLSKNGYKIYVKYW